MVNVNSESVIAQKVEKEEAIKKAQEKKVKFNVEFDEKHYLNTRLSKGEDKREIVVRLLPFSERETSPFKKVYVHSVKITNEKGEKQWKKFMCPEKMGKSDGCPFCETAARARQLRFDSTDELKKAQYKDQEFMNSVKEYWLVRCIERGHEEDGVKFTADVYTTDGKTLHFNRKGIYNRYVNKHSKEIVKSIFVRYQKCTYYVNKSEVYYNIYFVEWLLTLLFP